MLRVGSKSSIDRASTAAGLQEQFVVENSMIANIEIPSTTAMQIKGKMLEFNNNETTLQPDNYGKF